MSAEAPTSRQLRRLGAVVIILIFGLGFAVSKIPELLRPESLTWVVTVPVRDGADGIKIGSQVLVGGIKQGRVISVSDIKGVKHGPEFAQELIRVEFELNSDITLARNAVIRRGASTAGNMGYLDIKFPGSPQNQFKPGEDRVIPIARTAPRGGPMASLIGRTNGEMLERISSQSGTFMNVMSDRKRILESNLTSTQSMIQQMDLNLGSDSIRISNRFQKILARYRMILEQLPLIQDAALRLQDKVDFEAGEIRSDLQDWRHRFSLIDVSMDAGREDVDVMRRFTERLEPRLQAVALDLQAAMQDADSIATRFQGLAPDISDGLNRTMARMVLAGGQLKRAMNDLLPLAIEAITTRPNRSSESMRLLFESTNDVVLAGMQLRDAARFLEEVSRRGQAGASRESDPPPNLDESLRILQETMNRLAERLRQEIEAELR